MERTRNYLSNKDICLEVFSSEAYLVINKKLLSIYGPNTSVFISNLIDKYKYFRDNTKLVHGDWFFLTHEQQMEQTGLGLRGLRHSKNLLRDEGILETRISGAPPKEFYKLNFDKLLANTYGMINHVVSEGLIISKRDDYIKENKYKDEDIFGSPKKTKKIQNIIPPDLQWIKNYCKERKNSVDPENFFDWNSSKNWMIGKNKMVDWQAAVRTWERRENKEVTKFKAKFVIDDGRRYDLCPDGLYRNKGGDIYYE